MTIDIDLKKSINDSYQIYIEDLRDLSFEKKVAIITNSTVKKLHLEKLKAKLDAREVIVIELPDGEQYKNLETINEILEQLCENRFNRNSLLIALGGGVIGDMTGFSAAIFQRGIDFIQIPTTLLAMVDASVGGKTGVNNSFGKNLIGAFHQPNAVHIDPRFLETLPSREFGAGVAELIKMAVMFDKNFFQWLETNTLYETENLKKAISRSVALKAEVVSQDEKEKGVRAVLNYGHTFGHVMERETEYKSYLHGECVGMGMVMANQLSMRLGDLKEEESIRVENLLKQYKIPTHYHLKSVDLFYDAFFLDKKSGDNEITFILPKGIGAYQIRKDIDKSDIIAVLKNFN